MMTGSLLDRRRLIGGLAASALLPALAEAGAANDAATKEASPMRIRMSFDGRVMTATLADNPSARDFFAMLPLDLVISDYSTNEKIAYLTRKLTEAGSGPFDNERPYDLCYYKPWGNLAMFHAPYRHPGLIRLGRFDAGFEALHVRGEYPLRIEAL